MVDFNWSVSARNAAWYSFDQQFAEYKASVVEFVLVQSIKKVSHGALLKKNWRECRNNMNCATSRNRQSGKLAKRNVSKKENSTKTIGAQWLPFEVLHFNRWRSYFIFSSVALSFCFEAANENEAKCTEREWEKNTVGYRKVRPFVAVWSSPGHRGGVTQAIHVRELIIIVELTNKATRYRISLDQL